MLNRLSPARSKSPLDTFISCSAEAGPVAAAVVEATIRSSPSPPPTWGHPSPFLATPSSLRRASSVAHSDAWSVGSSVRSVDSRGSRRGRKGWSQGKNCANSWDMTQTLEAAQYSLPQSRSNSQSRVALKPQEDFSNFQVNEDPLHSNTEEKPFYCTWPTCSARFRYRYDWARHEEAVHYCPFNWICCHSDTDPCLLCRGMRHTTVKHCTSCADKELGHRTFLREDQLAQHIKRAHNVIQDTKLHVPKELLLSWKVQNPGFNKQHLRCGFCGFVSDTWEQRQDHVYIHLRKGICKSSWWSGRKTAMRVDQE